MDKDMVSGKSNEPSKGETPGEQPPGNLPNGPLMAEMIGAQLAAIERRIAGACRRVGRSVDEVTLVGVSKTFPVEVVRHGIEAGIRVLGENRVQEAAAKIPLLQDIVSERGVAWHLIGHLQSNKARRAVELFDMIHSVDSLRLAERIDSVSGELGKRMPILLEINLGEEASKSGVSAEEVVQLCESVAGLPHLELRGLMTVPPFLDDPGSVRPYFSRLRELRDEVIRRGIVDRKFRDLSMGMSHDFEVAIEEGATIVRIGTAIFGTRTGYATGLGDESTPQGLQGR